MQVNVSSLKILHVIVSLDPAAGGPPNVLSRLAAAQAELGNTVSTLSYGGEGVAERVAKDLANVPGRDRVNNIYLDRGGWIERRFSPAARTKCDELIANVDVVHLHGVWESILRHAAASARKYSKPYLIAPHGMLDPWSLSQKKLKKQIALALAYRKMLNGAAALHLLNADEESLIAPLRLSCGKQIIPNGIFLDEIYPLPERGAFRARFPKLADHLYILFLGRLHFKKGLDYLADAFARVAKECGDVDLVIAGPDDGERANFEAAIAKANLQNRVHIVGPLYGQQKIEAYVDSAVFCLPSRQEGFSVAIVEAMACGVPVVISRACHFPEVATANAGTVTDLDADEIASAVLKTLANPSFAAEQGKAGMDLIQTRYVWPRIAEKSVEVYRVYLK